MKKLTLLALSLASTCAFAQFTEGNLVVGVIGDNGDQTDNQPVALREFTLAGVQVGSDLSLNNVGGRNLTTTYGETSEGQVSRSGNGLFLTLCGYDLAPHSFATFSTYDTPRVVSRVGFNKGIIFSNNFTVYNNVTLLGDGVRGAFSRTGKDFIVTGGDAGLTLGEFGGPINQYFGGDYSSRSVTWYGGQYVYNGSNAYFGGNGLATWDGNPSNAPIPLFASSAGSSREFVFTSPSVCYVSTSTGSVGLVKYVFSAGAWNEAYRLGGTGVNGLAVDTSGVNPVVYCTSSNGQTLRKTVDSGTAFSAWEVLSTAAAGTRYRGLDWTPNQYETVVPNEIVTTSGTELNGGIDTVAASDDNRYTAFNDEFSLQCTIEATGTVTAPSVSELRLKLELSADRLGLAYAVRLRNYSLNTFSLVGGGSSSSADVTSEYVLTSSASNFVNTNGETKVQVNWSPINDEDPAQDGWLHNIDRIEWKIKP